MIDAAHHARELTGISEVFYAMVRVLHGYVHNDKQVRSWLGHNGLYFIPVINWDSVKLISRMWDETGEFSYIRKNRNLRDEKCSGNHES